MRPFIAIRWGRCNCSYYSAEPGVRPEVDGPAEAACERCGFEARVFERVALPGLAAAREYVAAVETDEGVPVGSERADLHVSEGGGEIRLADGSMVTVLRVSWKPIHRVVPGWRMLTEAEVLDAYNLARGGL